MSDQASRNPHRQTTNKSDDHKKTGDGLNSKSAVALIADQEMSNVPSVPSTRAAVGISLALICDAQSLCWRVEEHFLVKSSKLSKIFLYSSSCKTLQAAKKNKIFKQIQIHKLFMRPYLWLIFKDIVCSLLNTNKF